MSEQAHPGGNGSGGTQHVPGADVPLPVNFCALDLEDVAALINGHVDKDGEKIWFPHPNSDGDYAKCCVSKKPDAPYGVNLWVSEGDKQEVLDFLVETLNLSKELHKLTPEEKASLLAIMRIRRKKKVADHAYDLGYAKANHWDIGEWNPYLECESGEPPQLVTSEGPECVHKYFERRKLLPPDVGVIRFKPVTFITLGKRNKERTEVWEPAQIVALTFNPVTGAEDGIHVTYIDAEGMGVEHTWIGNKNKPTRKRTLASASGVIKLHTVAGSRRLVVAEGWENALSAMLLPEFDGCTIWSTSTGYGLQQLPALDEFDEITIIVDCDTGKGKEASEACAKRWHYARKKVWLLKPIPPAGREQDYDLNDVIREPNFAIGCGYEIIEFKLGGGDKPSAYTIDDFVAYMPQHNYIFLPTNDTWPPESVNVRLARMPLLDKFGLPVLDKDGKPIKISAATWLDKNQPVEQLTWAPGDERIIRNRLITNGGWIERQGAACLN